VEKRVEELMAEEQLSPDTKHGYKIRFGARPPDWPFNKVTDMRGRDVGVVALVAPFVKYYYLVRLSALNFSD
jgi:hypothetical protein